MTSSLHRNFITDVSSLDKEVPVKFCVSRPYPEFGYGTPNPHRIRLGLRSPSAAVRLSDLVFSRRTKIMNRLTMAQLLSHGIGLETQSSWV